MWVVIPFLNLLQENLRLFVLPSLKPVFICKVWEDNKVALHLLQVLNSFAHLIKYNHFWSLVHDGTITINSINTGDQIANISQNHWLQSIFVIYTISCWAGDQVVSHSYPRYITYLYCTLHNLFIFLKISLVWFASCPLSKASMNCLNSPYSLQTWKRSLVN